MVAMTVAMARRGAFVPRANLELWDGEGEEEEAVAVPAAGRPAEADVLLEYPHRYRAFGRPAARCRPSSRSGVRPSVRTHRVARSPRPASWTSGCIGSVP